MLSVNYLRFIVLPFLFRVHQTRAQRSAFRTGEELDYSVPMDNTIDLDKLPKDIPQLLSVVMINQPMDQASPKGKPILNIVRNDTELDSNSQNINLVMEDGEYDSDDDDNDSYSDDYDNLIGRNRIKSSLKLKLSHKKRGGSKSYWSKCSKKAAKICIYACKGAYRSACKTHKCTSKLKRAIKKTCKTTCKRNFK